VYFDISLIKNKSNVFVVLREKISPIRAQNMLRPQTKTIILWKYRFSGQITMSEREIVSPDKPDIAR